MPRNFVTGFLKPWSPLPRGVTEGAEIPPRIGIVLDEHPRPCELCSRPIAGRAIWWQSGGTWYTAHLEDSAECPDRLALIYLIQRVG